MVTLYVEDEYYDIYDKLSGEELDSFDDCDDLAWHIDWKCSGDWIVWDTADLVKRYESDYPAKDFYQWRKDLKDRN